MRRNRWAGVLATIVVAGTTAVATYTASGTATAAAAEQYNWRNVQIAGGGFVPGIIFNQSRKDLIYARTDIGGAYRWNQGAQQWTPLLDWVGQGNWGWNGVVSLATDEVEPNRVYAAAGMYTTSWDPNNGAILRSSDQGRTWQATTLPFKLGGNMPGRGMGERLAIDPNRNNILYFGAPSGKGLWRSTDSGVTWSQVTNFPNPGNYVQDPANEYTADNQGIVWVTFDKTTGTAGSMTRGIYVGVADRNNTVYRSTDGGATWHAVPGAPTGYIAHKGMIDHTNRLLYIATSDTGGPYDGAKGDVWKFSIGTGAWTRISPVPSTSSANTFGYSGLTIDRQRPGTLMVATQVSWWPDIVIFRSTDSGATWKRIWDYESGNRVNRYRMDISAAPWLDWGATPTPPEQSPKLGWMTEAMEIDPFNSDRMMYGTGATIYGSTDLTKWDAGQTFTIRPVAAGLEETAIRDLASPPSGPSLISAMLDVDGFRHDDLTKVPAKMHGGGARSLDFAEKSPNIVVRSSKQAYFSTDGGATWFTGGNQPVNEDGGTIAAAADGSRFVWAPNNSPVVYTAGLGSSWGQASGLPQNAVVESDRVNSMTFYGFSGGRFYVSTNGGASFTATAATGLPSGGKFKAVAGHEGHIWLTGRSGLFRSTDSGASFTKISGVDSGISVGYGKSAPGRTYHALFLAGKVDGVDGVFRSDDTGATWVRINDDQHQYGNMGEAITGDPRVYGRVYLGTNGRGILYADRVGGPNTPPTSAPTSPPVTTPPTSTPPTTAPPTSQPPSGSCAVTYTVINDWSTGFQADVRIANTGTSAINGWELTWAFSDGQRIGQVWNGNHAQAGPDVTVRDAGWNRAIPAGGSVTFGFTSTKGATSSGPSTFTLNGVTCGR